MTRRKRFEIIAESARWQALAYPNAAGEFPSNALEHYKSLGYTVLSARPLGRQIMPKQAWAVNHVALTDACKTLDIRWPVRVKRTANSKKLYGRHRLHSFPELSHTITLAAGLRVQQASEVLWHELAHAMQAEREVRELDGWENLSPKRAIKIWCAADARSRKLPYSSRPCEIEARSYESRGYEFPLVQATGS